VTAQPAFTSVASVLYTADYDVDQITQIQPDITNWAVATAELNALITGSSDYLNGAPSQYVGWIKSVAQGEASIINKDVSGGATQTFDKKVLVAGTVLAGILGIALAL
jgi:hypothetical protein